MAEELKSKDIEHETSFGKYFVKQIYQQVVTWGGILGGGLLGIVSTKSFFKEEKALKEIAEHTWLTKIPGLKDASKNRLLYGGGIGAVVGLTGAGMLLGYEHWKKIKQSQMQVDEITKDISDIEVFKKTDPELKAENERLWAELKKQQQGVVQHEKPAHHAKTEHHEAREQKSHTDKLGIKQHESWQQQAADSAQNTMEASR